MTPTLDVVRLNVCALPPNNSYVEALTPGVMVFGDGALEVMRFR